MSARPNIKQQWEEQSQPLGAATKTLRRARVLMLLENNPYPGDPRVRREAVALAQAGYQVTVICPKGDGQPWTANVDGVRVYRFPMAFAPSGFLGYVWEYGYSLVAMSLLSIIVFFREGFDIIHAHNPPDVLFLIGTAYKILGKRFIYDHHDLTPEMYYARFGGHGNALVYRVLLILERLSCRVADHVIATNESYRSIETGRCHTPADRVTIVRNGPDLRHFAPVEPDQTLRQKGKTIIGYAGVMGVQDGVDYLIRALDHLSRGLGRDDFFCVIIGQGEALDSLKNLTAELDLTDHIQFTGWATGADYLRYLCAADICVDPDPSNSYNDRSTMNKMMEYMALGKPIVAFDLPEHRFTAQTAAVFVEGNDERQMAEAVARLMDDPRRREALGAAARHRVEHGLAWHHSVPHLLDAYKKVFSRT